MRNYYVGLDYKDNLIHIGLNRNGTKAEMVLQSGHPDFDGSKGNGSPGKSKSDNTILIVILIFVLIVVSVAITWFIRQRKQKKVQTPAQKEVVVAEQVTDLDKLGPDGLDVSDESENAEKLLSNDKSAITKKYFEQS